MPTNLINKSAIHQMVICLLIALYLAMPTAVFAQRAGEVTRSKAVRISDLDMRSSADRATLDRRVRHAAREVCGPRIGFYDFAADRCEKTAVQRAQTNALASVALRRPERISSR